MAIFAWVKSKLVPPKASKYGLSSEQVRKLIARVVNDGQKLEQAAREFLKRT